jgi:hypothetical protein
LFRDPILRFSSIRLFGNVEGSMPDKEFGDKRLSLIQRTIRKKVIVVKLKERIFVILNRTGSKPNQYVYLVRS